MTEIEETESARLDWGFEGKGTGLSCTVVRVGYCSRTLGKVNEESSELAGWRGSLSYYAKAEMG